MSVSLCVSQNSPPKTAHGGMPLDVLHTLGEEKTCHMVDTKINTEVKNSLSPWSPKHAWTKIMTAMRSNFTSMQQKAVIVAGLQCWEHAGGVTGKLQDVIILKKHCYWTSSISCTISAAQPRPENFELQNKMLWNRIRCIAMDRSQNRYDWWAGRWDPIARALPCYLVWSNFSGFLICIQETD